LLSIKAGPVAFRLKRMERENPCFSAILLTKLIRPYKILSALQSSRCARNSTSHFMFLDNYITVYKLLSIMSAASQSKISDLQATQGKRRHT
jgi:hypothetical protein